MVYNGPEHQPYERLGFAAHSLARPAGLAVVAAFAVGWSSAAYRDGARTGPKFVPARRDTGERMMKVDAPENPSALAALGQRLRAARHARGMSQDNVAQPEFTKSYVSAV